MTRATKKGITPRQILMAMRQGAIPYDNTDLFRVIRYGKPLVVSHGNIWGRAAISLGVEGGELRNASYWMRSLKFIKTTTAYNTTSFFNFIESLRQSIADPNTIAEKALTYLHPEFLDKEFNPMLAAKYVVKDAEGNILMATDG